MVCLTKSIKSVDKTSLNKLHYNKGEVSMEFLKVDCNHDADVLINEQANGFTNKLIRLTRGIYKVSVAKDNATIEKVRLTGTSEEDPKIVRIEVDV